ncbi:MAG: phosphate ABC transporter permease PstA [Candidatus Eremiobacteraeota bacterium]|nr:phosphate ABC transporter permease PstA [Candidatus Eremiobacteraeota bacterium]
MRSLRAREAWSAFMVFIAWLCAGIAAGLLAIIVLYVVQRGAGAMNLAFFTKLPAPLGISGGGVANAIVGSFEIIAMACVGAIPVGVLAGIYLALLGRGRLAFAVRFFSDVLTGVPSIAIGVFAYTVVVVPQHHFSAFSAGVALAIIMLPIVVRTTEEAVRLVPTSIREGALALGIPMWKAILLVTVPVARPGIVTGALLSIARVAGESAPLLFTAFGNDFWSAGPSDRTAALPLTLFRLAISGFPDWQQLAWGAALTLIVLVFVINITARSLFPARMSFR